jgi:hypothetical protein
MMKLLLVVASVLNLKLKPLVVLMQMMKLTLGVVSVLSLTMKLPLLVGLLLLLLLVSSVLRQGLR